MTKEKFLFELIDKALYPDMMKIISYENYTLKSNFEKYKNLHKTFMDYKEHFEKLEKGNLEKELDQNIIDVLLLQDINYFRNLTISSYVKVMQEIIDNSKIEFDLKENLLQNISNNSFVVLDRETVQTTLETIRLKEYNMNQERGKANV